MTTISDVDIVGVWPGSGLVGTLERACRRAVRDGQTVVSSAGVLRQGVVMVAPELRQFPSPWSRAWRQCREVVDDDPPSQRSGLFPAFDQQVALFSEGALREAAHRGGAGVCVFSPLVGHAVYEAVHEASRRDGVPAGVRHLLAAIFDVPGNAAVKLAEQMADGHRSLILDRQAPRYRAGDNPRDWAPAVLKALRVLPSNAPRTLQLPWNAAVATGLHFTVRRPFLRHGARYGHPVLPLVEGDAGAQAVRLGRDHAGTAELLLSILDLHEQLHAAGAVLPEPAARHNTAGQILREHGVTLIAATMAAAQSPPEPQIAVDPATVPTKGWPPAPRTRRPEPPLDAGALLALRTASAAARQAGDPFAGTTHLLVSILRDSDGPAAELLRRVGASPEAIAGQASGQG